MASPIRLTIYNNEHEVQKELQTSLVPWGLLKRAIRLARLLGLEDGSELTGNLSELLKRLDESGFDELTGLVCDLFHGRVTVDELNWGSDAMEMVTVLQAVVTRAFSEFGGAGDPTKQG